MLPHYDEDGLSVEMEIMRLSWEIARERAEETVREEGMSSEDEEYWMQVELETRRQWNEDMEREQWKRQMLEPD